MKLKEAKQRLEEAEARTVEAVNRAVKAKVRLNISKLEEEILIKKAYV